MVIDITNEKENEKNNTYIIVDICWNATIRFRENIGSEKAFDSR